jgi:hypothetical protein
VTDHLYFAYGSNLFARQMAALAPGAAPMGFARLQGWELFVTEHGVLSIRRRPGPSVLGLLWACSSADLDALDRFEAVDEELYVRELLPVLRCERPTIGGFDEPVDATVTAGDAVQVHVYRSVSDRPGRPRPGYLEIAVIAPMRALGFADAYIESVESFLTAGTSGAPWVAVPGPGSAFTA